MLIGLMLQSCNFYTFAIAVITVAFSEALVSSLAHNPSGIEPSFSKLGSIPFVFYTSLQGS